ncbi:hypothetical protein WJX74_002869 [Apatococcus lobatus]|uniref:UDENN domain-containing protein n=1 Tax=Apatococcus lobatus TaxID=904363 RepID=A0AAW1QDK2_9CHLO
MEVDSSNPSSSTEGSRAPRLSNSTDSQKNPHGLLPFFVDGNPIKSGRKTLRSAFSGAFFKGGRSGGKWFNPEDFTAQKREWARQFGGKDKVIGWPAKCFEHFLVVGLPPTADVNSAVADAITAHSAKQVGADIDVLPESKPDSQHRGHIKGRPLQPQVLYKYPPDKPVISDVAAFCFPHGVQPMLLERTPSMSSLNQLIYSQRFQQSDDSSFIFLLKVADNLPLYGVCCYMEEMVHRPPALLNDLFPDHNAPLSRYLISAPRCYCFLTHYPFFPLHFKVLHMLMGLERLERITAFIDEAAEAGIGDMAAPDPQDSEDSYQDASESKPQLLSQRSGQLPQKISVEQQMELTEQLSSRLSRRVATSAAPNGMASPASGRLPKGAPARPGLPSHGSYTNLAADPGAQSLLNLDQGYDEEWGTFGTRPSRPSTSDTSSLPGESPHQPRSSGTRPSKSEASSIREGSPYPPDADGASPAAFGDLPRTHPHLFRDTRSSGELPDAELRDPQQSRSQHRWQPQPNDGSEPNSGLASPFAEPHAQHASLPGQDGFQQSSSYRRTGSTDALPLLPYAPSGLPPAGRRRTTREAHLALGESPPSLSHADSGMNPDRHPSHPNLIAAQRQSSAVLKRASERLRKVMEAQSEGSAGPQQIIASSALSSAPAFHTRSLPPPSPPQASGAGVLPVGTVGPPVRRHTRTHSGNIPKLNTPPSTYAGRNPFSEPDPSVQPSAASDASISSFYTAVEDGVESGGPSFVDRSQRDANRSGGPFAGDRAPHTQRPSVLGAGADRSAQSPLPPIATGNSRFAHHAQVNGRVGETVYPEAGTTEPISPTSRRRGMRSMSLRGSSHRNLAKVASTGELARICDPANAMQVLQAYWEAPVPQPGEEFEFNPDASLQPIHYRRSKLHDASPLEYVHRAAIVAAESEAADGLRVWTVANLCRSLSLENILTLLTGALLERQMVVFCPNLGVLSVTTLALIPLLRPFAWQSLLLPILPASMLAFLEAPVPFILGVQYKTGEVASRCGDLIRVNVYKDKVKNASLPPLPNDRALVAALTKDYSMLATMGEEKARNRPIYSVTDSQRGAAERLLRTVQNYLGGLCDGIKQHAITDVQTSDRVSVLFKDSFLDSFANKDKPFMRQFLETQMFSVYSDSVIN